MTSLTKILKESSAITLYRGVNPAFGDINPGKQSIGVKNKLVGAWVTIIQTTKKSAEIWQKSCD